jgi:hypothetical protein
LYAVHRYSRNTGKNRTKGTVSHSNCLQVFCDPASTVADRFALFRLPDRWDRWPTHLRVTAKATFVRRRARRLVVTLTQPA